jgi:GT2 family glycosyltransferase
MVAPEVEISKNRDNIKMNPLVSIAILNWNSLDFLKRFLPILIDRTPEHLAHVVIIDNGSTDGTAGWVATHYPDIHLMVLDRNYGYAGGYAIALEQLSTKYVVLLNSDIEVTEKWLDGMIQFMEEHPAAAALAPRILSHQNPGQFEYAGAAGGWIDRFGFPFCRGRIFNSLEDDNGQYSTPEKIFWASGACMLVRTEDYHHAGGLDPEFFAHMEEIDLCWRLQASGGEIWYYPDSSVYHVGGGTLPNESPYKLFLNFRNNLILLHKNLSGSMRRRILFSRQIFDGIAAIQYLFKGKPQNFRAVLRAHTDFKRIRKEKYGSYTARVFRDPLTFDGYYNGSIVAAFFIKRIRLFRNLRLQR